MVFLYCMNVSTIFVFNYPLSYFKCGQKLLYWQRCLLSDNYSLQHGHVSCCALSPFSHYSSVNQEFANPDPDCKNKETCKLIHKHKKLLCERKESKAKDYIWMRQRPWLVFMTCSAASGEDLCHFDPKIQCCKTDW